MNKQRRHFADHEKVAILKRHLIEKVPVSDLCDELDLYPNQFYDWLKKFFENGHLAFANGRKPKAAQDAQARKIEQLEAKVTRKNEVLAELMEEHTTLKKKSWGELKGRWVPHDTRDQVVDFVRAWSDKTEIPAARFLPWLAIAASKFHDWKRRFGKVNEHNAWVPRDHWLTELEQERIGAFAKGHPLEGYRRLTFMMLDADQVACSPASVYRVLKAAGLLAGQTPKATKKGTGFVQPLAPHEHWHIDVSYLNVAGTFYFLCSLLDGCSRLIVHWEIREKMEENDVQTIVQRAREQYAAARPRLISDNGPQFIAKDFKEFLRVAGMTHVRTSPYYPQSNGKIERWHKTLKGDCIRPKVPLSLEDARRLVAEFVAYYNQVRLHSAIGYITPQDRLDGRHREIFAERDRKLAEAREQRRRLRQAEREAVACHPGDTSPGDMSVTADAGSGQACHLDVTTRPAVDFPALRAVLSISAVLNLLGFQPRSRRGAQERGPCPLHGSHAGTSRAFSVNLEQHAFHCFKCGRAGNALDLWAYATHQPPYEAALDLCQRLTLQLPTLSPPKPNRNREEPVAPAPKNDTMPSTAS